MSSNPTPHVPGEFQDPLQNYDPPTYKDPLEQALGERKVADIQSQPYVSIAPETTIADALRKLSDSHVACLLVTTEGRLVGVFSDRDFLKRAALEFDEIKQHPVREVMTADPVFVYETDSAAAALAVMAVSGFRHVPVVNLERQVTGIVSPLRVLNFLQQHSDGA